MNNTASPASQDVRVKIAHRPAAAGPSSPNLARLRHRAFRASSGFPRSGRPRAASAALLAGALLASPIAQAKDTQGAVVGWRGDGTGRFSGATPPRSWSAGKPATAAPAGAAAAGRTEARSLRWAAPLPDWSNGSPVVSAGRVFVTAEPTWLLAFDAASGKLLWKQRNEILDTLPAAEAGRREREARQLGRELEQRRSAFDRLRRKLRSRRAGPELKARVEAEKSAVNAIRKRFEAVERYLPLPPFEDVGYSSGSPVSGGNTVCALFGNGVASCFGHDGKRRFSVHTGEPRSPMNGNVRGSAASPLIVAGSLVVAGRELTALDLRTGALRWRSVSYADFGSPVLAHLHGVDLILTPAGEAVRASDGKLLARGLPAVWYTGPVVQDDIAYYVGAPTDDARGRGSHAEAVKLTLDGDSLRHQRLYRVPLESIEYYAGHVVDGGLLYAVSKGGTLTALDARTGARVYREQLAPRTAAVFRPSIALAAGLLFITNDHGETFVVRAGRRYEPLGSHTIDERTWSTPFLDGSRAYVRGQGHLYCFGDR